MMLPASPMFTVGIIQRRTDKYIVITVTTHIANRNRFTKLRTFHTASCENGSTEFVSKYALTLPVPFSFGAPITMAAPSLFSVPMATAAPA
ncbi:MAG: hypothetical protein R3E67_08510 [Pseudomonadales bacterium]